MINVTRQDSQSYRNGEFESNHIKMVSLKFVLGTISIFKFCPIQFGVLESFHSREEISMLSFVFNTITNIVPTPLYIKINLNI
jgi:hypothetical protein